MSEQEWQPGDRAEILDCFRNRTGRMATVLRLSRARLGGCLCLRGDDGRRFTKHSTLLAWPADSENKEGGDLHV